MAEKQLMEDIMNGTTISAANKHYASDSNWANAIYNIMKGLYNNL